MKNPAIARKTPDQALKPEPAVNLGIFELGVPTTYVQSIKQSLTP